MEKLDVKLIALDLDDTLLNDERQITDETVLAIRECAEKGIYVVLCSGRAEEAILPYVRRLEIAGKETGRYLIAINGCSIFDLHKREQIFCRKVEPEILLRANQIAEEYGLRSEVYTPDIIYYREETKWTKLDVDLCGLKGIEVENFEEFLKKGFTKMLIPGEPSELLKLQDILRKEFGKRAVIFISKPYFLEILPPECGKGEAISWLSKNLGFGIEKTMGFGDSMNDESMIRMCGYGVAMCNGLDEIKKIAKFVTKKDNNNDGIADFLREVVL
ncbi:Cof-type HAD-IIB family hydrolase [Treponema sp. C6A8]|uniref:Cof-type HAD-IIB family hydrolase n=1 Tax=Treponema sp. C6A8 TaxID=1410609 RepID=UPI0004842481|nr:Cof-type HAD-IIB family hydrolase [Treponema sp. C6A8]